MKFLIPHLFAVFAVALPALTPIGWTQTTPTLTTVYSFDTDDNSNYSDGSTPDVLIQGHDGNFYGTTAVGGINNNGTIFEITPAGEFTTIYRFPNLNGGSNPNSLVQSRDGNLYGTTTVGGTGNLGTVFAVTPRGVFTPLYSFTGGTDGASPSRLIQGRDGNFYGVTQRYGTDDGTIFSVTPAGALAVLHRFTGGADGASPSRLIQGSDGNFYGTTAVGGSNGNGIVFSLTPAGTFTTLYSFTGGADGTSPSTLIQGSDGNFYGTTFGLGGYPGASSNVPGTVFSITPAGALTTLCGFADGDGGIRLSALIQGHDGNFYGVASGIMLSSGDFYGATLFSVTPAGVLSTLYSFSGFYYGNDPSAIVQGRDGSLYGTTAVSVGDFGGTIFKLNIGAPPAHTAFFTGEAALSNGVYYLSFPRGNYFGYYSDLPDPRSIYHFDLGYEYVFDADDGKGGVYLYDFASSDFFYTSPTFPFPYLYDFGLDSVVYYFPDPDNPGRYNTDGVRYFYVFKTGEVIAK